MKLHEICGNEHAKRALEVAAVGGHSIRFIGSYRSQMLDLFVVAKTFGLTASYTTPCYCGEWGSPTTLCTCEPSDVDKWRVAQITSTRYDLTIEVQVPDAFKQLAHLHRQGELEDAVSGRIERARLLPVPPLTLDEMSESLLKLSIGGLSLGFNQTRSILGVAQSIARLADSEKIQAAHLAEAIQYQWRPR